MSKTRIIMLSLLAALAASVFASASVLPVPASAHEFLTEGKKVEKGGRQRGRSPRKLDLPVTIDNKMWQYSCGYDTVRRIWINAFSYEDVRTYFECEWYDFSNGRRIRQPNCVVRGGGKGTFEAEGELVGRGEVKEKGLKSEETLEEITVEGESCEIAGTYKVKGTETCEIPEPELEKVIHEFICTPAGSKIKIKGETNKGEKIETETGIFDIEYVEMESLQAWSDN
jgi:hypothetical protein